MMTREVYQALKTRMSVKQIAIDRWHWEFDNSGLNEGIDCFDQPFIDAMMQNVSTGNIWNCAQMAYRHLCGLHKPDDNVDARLIANPLKK